LQVVEALRTLGLRGRAKEVGEAALASATDKDVKSEAAMTLYSMSTELDDSERYLESADESVPRVRIAKLQVAAQRLMQEAEYEQADKKLAEITQFYEAT